MRRGRCALLFLVGGLAAAPAAQAQLGLEPTFGGVETANGVVSPERDLAFGAFQRGYFATALQEAMARVAKNPHDGAALALIGEIYSQGLAVRRDDAEAARWYKLASQENNREATFAMAMAALSGKGVAKDPVAAKALFERAAAQGHPGALYNLGVMAVDARDFVKAADLFGRASEAGDVDALEALSALYRQGAGVAQDLPRAIGLMKQAADAGDAGAQVQYGIILFNGEGIPKDEAGAARYFMKAAGVGNPIGENRLARLYAAGRGIGKNVVEAARWHIMARAAGIKDSWLDGILAALTPAERSRVEDMMRRQL